MVYSTVAGMVAGIASGLTIEKAFNKQSHAVLPWYLMRMSNTGRYRKIKSQVTISVLMGSENSPRVTELLTKYDTN